MSVTVNGDKEFVSLMKRLGNNWSRALYISLNRTRTTVGKEVGKKLGGTKGHLGLSVAQVKEHVFLKPPSTSSKLITGVEVKGYPTPIDFNSFKLKLAKRGVSFRVRADKGREKFRHAFVRKNKVMIRRNKGKGRLKRMYGPSVPNALAESGTLTVIEKIAAERLLVVLEQQALRFEKKINT